MNNQLSQIIHDIKSPLTVLKALAMKNEDISTLTEKELLLKNVSRRIEEMLEELIKELNSPELQQKTTTFEKHELFPVCQEIVTEKRAHYKYNPLIKINFTNETSNVCAQFDPPLLKRILSNLINNAVEAKKRFGIKINVSLTTSKNKICISVSDNGQGIPKEIIPELTKKGFSYNKESGSGLGLHHAKQNIDLWGGLFKISSTVGKGTIVDIILPQA